MVAIAEPAVAAPPGVAAIEVRDLVKEYPNGVRALDGVSLSVAPGTVFGLLGPNGAGKSTTVKILTTLARATSGAARVAGLDVVREPNKVRASIGVVGQQSAHDHTATGRENLRLQGRLYGMRGRALEERITQLLEELDLADAADRATEQYSGGMQRRLDIAMGLVHSPRVLFLDEPTTGLDPEIRASIWTEVTRLSREEGLTILMTTHYLEEADRLADRVAIIDAGRVVAEGTPAALKAELRGDAVSIEVAERALAEQARAVLEGAHGVGNFIIDGVVLHARIESAAFMPSLLARLDTAGIVASSFAVSRPSLDDVYLHHTGHAYRAAGVGTEGEAR